MSIEVQHLEKGVVEEFMKTVGYHLANQVRSKDVNAIQDHIYVNKYNIVNNEVIVF